MKYYTEEDTKELRLTLEKRIFIWPNVTTKKMFGCPCYQVNNKLFVFLVTKGIVFTQLGEVDINELSQKYDTAFFQAGKKIVKKWIRVSIDSKDLEKIMPYVEKSYETALRNT
jgi:hypothetical protein